MPTKFRIAFFHVTTQEKEATCRKSDTSYVGNRTQCLKSGIRRKGETVIKKGDFGVGMDLAISIDVGSDHKIEKILT
jgi:hypothetical protein